MRGSGGGEDAIYTRKLLCWLHPPQATAPLSLVPLPNGTCARGRRRKMSKWWKEAMVGRRGTRVKQYCQVVVVVVSSGGTTR